MSSLLPVPFDNPYTYRGHTGVDFPKARGTAFRASGNGRVSSIDYGRRPGHTVWVQYDAGPNVGYAHMDSRTTDVELRQRVVEGTVLGRVGSLGTYSTGPHLHVEVAGWATTAGFWRFFDAHRVVSVVGSGSGINPNPQPPMQSGPLTPLEDDEMIALKITDGATTHFAALGEGRVRHFLPGDPYDRIMRIMRAADDWQTIDKSEVPAFLKTWGVDLDVVRFVGGRMEIDEPFTGWRQGGMWSDTNALRAAFRAAAPQIRDVEA